MWLCQSSWLELLLRMSGSSARCLSGFECNKNASANSEWDNSSRSRIICICRNLQSNANSEEAHSIQLGRLEG